MLEEVFASPSLIMGRHGDERTDRPRLLVFVARVLLEPLLAPRILGAERIPKTGPVILAPVHRSNLDAPVVWYLCPRRVAFMAKASLWRAAPLGALLTRWGAFPVERGQADRAAMSQASSVLEAGGCVVLFPEGTTKSGMGVDDLKDGAMYLAARTGAQIVPIGIWGTEQALGVKKRRVRRSRVTLFVGDPLAPPCGQDGTARVPRSAIKAGTDQLERALEDAMARAREGVLDPVVDTGA